MDLTLKKLWLLFISISSPMILQKGERERENENGGISARNRFECIAVLLRVSLLPHYRQFLKSDELNANTLNLILDIQQTSNISLSCELPLPRA